MPSCGSRRANVTLGAEDYESEVGFDGEAVYIGIPVALTANLLGDRRRPRVLKSALLPHGLNGEISTIQSELCTARSTGDPQPRPRR